MLKYIIQFKESGISPIVKSAFSAGVKDGIFYLKDKDDVLIFWANTSDILYVSECDNSAANKRIQ